MALTAFEKKKQKRSLVLLKEVKEILGSAPCLGNLLMIRLMHCASV